MNIRDAKVENPSSTITVQVVPHEGIVNLSGDVQNQAQPSLNRQVRSIYAADFSPATSRQSSNRWR
ncbi:MAG: hypothetical protein KME10_26910, partial [Plectolyngbya sp. WJT66-NPBG17]|nr:hypothetical protein [Plectolyngbya sp. WJT66-NPBG17]